MYVRTIKHQNKDGSVVEYVQLSHNTRHHEKGYSRAEVIYSFGRRDQLEAEVIKRLISSLSRFISPVEAGELQASTGGSNGLRFVSSRSAGGAIVLNALWERINIKQCLDKILKDRSFTAPMTQDLFTIGASRKERCLVRGWLTFSVAEKLTGTCIIQTSGQIHEPNGL